MPTRDRPYVICHMMPSIDGRIVVTKWKQPKMHAVYEKTGAALDGDAWIIGRVSMAPYAGTSKVPMYKGAKIPRADFVADAQANQFAIAVDPSGKLTWRKAYIDHEHVITVLTEKVPDAYLAFLQKRGVSYIFAGAKDLNLDLALRKLKTLFGIERLLLEGGGGINGTFLDAGLIDELSIVVAPVADGSIGTVTLFDAQKATGQGHNLKLIKHEVRDKDFVWLRYKVL